jgi:4-amino-4-deoxy-L-arabinose transferase-like glycosyltransferase
MNGEPTPGHCSNTASSTVLLAFAALVALCHIVAGSMFDWHRDELYLLQLSRHISDRFTDHAPLTPWLLHLADVVGDGSLVVLRIVPALFGAATIWLVAMTARELSDEPYAPWIAAIAVAVAPVFVYTSTVASTNCVEQCMAAAVGFAVVRIRSSDDSQRWRWWIMIGFAVGIAATNKVTALLFAATTAAGLLTTPSRTWFKTRWPWLAMAIAVTWLVWPLLSTPSGQTPLVGLLQAHHDARVRDVAWLDFLLGQFTDLGPIALIVIASGIAQSRRITIARAATISWLIGGVVLFAAHGKHYHWAPWHLAMIAFGAESCARWVRHRRGNVRRVIVATTAMIALCTWCMTLPVLPRATQHQWRLDAVNREFVQFADWSVLVQQVAVLRARQNIGSDVAVLTNSYGMASALEHYGTLWQEPAMISGGNSYHRWMQVWPDRNRILTSSSTVISLGYDQSLLSTFCTSLRIIGELHEPGSDGASNHFDFPRSVYLCIFAPGALAKRWNEFAAFD